MTCRLKGRPRKNLQQKNTSDLARPGGGGSLSGVPTLLLLDGLRFFFYSNEGSEPPHVHVEYGNGAAKFWLQPVALAEVYAMKQQTLRQARLLVEKHQTVFLEKWNDYFGT